MQPAAFLETEFGKVAWRLSMVNSVFGHVPEAADARRPSSVDAARSISSN
jgi:hypothetical protein